MPFEQRFDQVADVIKDTVLRIAASFPFLEQPRIDRVDWITSTGVIQQDIWQKVYEADLVFCDITGFNPNVLFESGVCAAWKDIKQVAFIRDHFFRQQSAFDIAPIRYIEYSLTEDRIGDFQQKIAKVVSDAVLPSPIDKAKLLRFGSRWRSIFRITEMIFACSLLRLHTAEWSTNRSNSAPSTPSHTPGRPLGKNNSLISPWNSLRGSATR
jgi:hypothetical protein